MFYILELLQLRSPRQGASRVRDDGIDNAASSGPTFSQFAYAGFPDQNGTILQSAKVGDNVVFTVNIPTAGTYDVKLSFKQYSARGISQLTINGSHAWLNP